MDLKIFKNFKGYEHYKQKQWFEEMALKGYILTDAKWLWFYFKKIESKKVVFEADFRILKKAEEKVYLEMMNTESKWIFATKANVNYWYYRDDDGSSNDLSLFNSNEDKKELYKRKIKFILILLCYPLYSSLIFLFLIRDWNLFINIVMTLNILIILLDLKFAVKYLVKYKNIKKELSE